jgi:site-specific DNA-methyltransferase (adenine-specific)
MKPYYQDKWVTIYHGDCREILPQLDVKVDLVLTDPPYGMKREESGHKVIARLGGIVGDDKPFDPAPLLGIGIKHIIWGANHFAQQLPNETRWLMWQKHDSKLYGLRSTSPFELAWTDLGGSCRAFRWIWDGSIKQGERTRTEHNHPTEKPPELMMWCLSLYPCQLVLDPYMGTGGTILASKRLNRYSIGIEIEEKYCEIAARRCSQEVMELSNV